MVRLLWPPRRPLAEGLGDRVEGLIIGHAANRMPSRPAEHYPDAREQAHLTVAVIYFIVKILSVKN